MKRILVTKNEGVASVIDKLISDPETAIVLVIPKSSILKESVSNFHLIHREAELAEKRVMIESVDDEVLALAKASRIDASHPILRDRAHAHSFSDIVPLGEAPKDEKRGRVEKEEALPVVHYHPTQAPSEELLKDISPRRHKRWGRRILTIIVFLCLMILITAWWVGVIFGKANIVLQMKKNPWSFDGTITADKRLGKVDFSNNVIPALLVTDKKNVTQLFSATGHADVSQKAVGKIKIYNAFGADPQVLVASTRFEAPDGKIFRLQNRVVVPGAAIQGGALVPSSIETAVIADEVGPAYNEGSIPKLTIPAFQGSPRYDKFYGVIQDGTSGGFTGRKPIPTDDDVAQAEKKATNILTSSLKTGFLSDRPPGLKIIDGASQVNITSLKVNKETNEQGNFSVFAEASFQAVAFREADLAIFMENEALHDTENTDLRDLQFSYSNPHPDFSGGKLVFSVGARGILVKKVSADDVKANLLGRSVDDVRTILQSLEGVENARVSLWPRWLQSIPKDSSRVFLEVR